MLAHGRPVYGDRWVKDRAGPKPFALREATARGLAALAAPPDMDVFSASDLDHLEAACASVRDGSANARLNAMPAWQSAPAGTYVPIASLLPQDAKGDAMLGRALEDAPFAAY